jgi:hypothetical protein
MNAEYQRIADVLSVMYGRPFTYHEIREIEIRAMNKLRRCLKAVLYEGQKQCSPSQTESQSPQSTQEQRLKNLFDLAMKAAGCTEESWTRNRAGLCSTNKHTGRLRRATIAHMFQLWPQAGLDRRPTYHEVAHVAGINPDSIATMLARHKKESGAGSTPQGRSLQPCTQGVTS